MPALPPVPNVLRAHLLFLTSPGTAAGCRFYFLYSGSAPSNSTCATIAGSIRAAFATDLASLMSNNFDLEQVEVTDMSSSTGGQGTDSTLVGGTRSGAPPTVDTAVNLAFQIARRYRGGKPKAFLPFGITTDLNSSESKWTTGFQTAVNSGWSSFDTAVLAISTGGTTLSQHVNVSYYEGFTPAQNPVTGRWRNIPKLRTGGPVVDTITGHAAAIEISQQRRRRTSTS